MRGNDVTNHVIVSLVEHTLSHVLEPMARYMSDEARRIVGGVKYMVQFREPPQLRMVVLRRVVFQSYCVVQYLLLQPL